MAKALQEQNRMKPFTGDTGANKEDDESDSDDKSFKRRLEKSIKKDLAEAEGGKTKSWKEKIKIQSKMIEAVFEVYACIEKEPPMILKTALVLQTTATHQTNQIQIRITTRPLL